MSHTPQMVGFIRFIGALVVVAGMVLYSLLTIIGEWRTGVMSGATTVLIGAALMLTTVRAMGRAKG